MHRFLSAEEAREVVAEFIERHPRRVWLASRALGWPDLHDDEVLGEFISTRPFVAFKPMP